MCKMKYAILLIGAFSAHAFPTSIQIFSLSPFFRPWQVVKRESCIADRAGMENGLKWPPWRMNCGYGIIGAGYKNLIIENHVIESGDLIILVTDGIREMISLEKYESDLLGDVHKLSQQILRDWRHSRDDAAVLVFKME